MAGKLNLFNLGSLGVNVDKSALHLEDGELSKAQNAIRDGIGQDGALRKRPGLVKYSSDVTGSILGGIGVPLALLTGGTVTRTTYWARQAKAIGLGDTQGWWSSTTGFTTSATQILSGTPGNPRTEELSDGSTPFSGLSTGMPGAAVVFQNRLYYAGTHTQGTDRPPIRIFDGTVDWELTRVPHNGVLTTNSTVIFSMLLVGSTIYVSTKDGTSGDGASRTGRVFALDPSSGALTQLGQDFPDGYQPYALAWHMGRLWAGTMYRSGGADAAGTISWIRPNIDTDWTLDRTMSQGRGCTFLISFEGQLYAGNWTGTSGTTGVVEQRDSVGAWTVSLSVGSLGNNSAFMHAVEFLGDLYCSLYNQTASVSTVRKFDGSTWTTALTTGDSKPLTTMWVNAAVIYAGGGGDNVTANLWTSTDGTSWTDRSANLTGTNMCGASLVGVLATVT